MVCTVQCGCWLGEGGWGGGGEYCRPIFHGYLDRELVTAVDCTAVQAHGIGQPLGRLYFKPLINTYKKIGYKLWRAHMCIVYAYAGSALPNSSLALKKSHYWLSSRRKKIKRGRKNYIRATRRQKEPTDGPKLYEIWLLLENYLQIFARCIHSER